MSNGKVAVQRSLCAQCPWRKANHGKRHPGGFFRKDNRRRLWNQIRRGGGIQSCHITDPSHPDHVALAGAKEGSTAKECMGSVVLVARELEILGGGERLVTDERFESYLAQSPARRGLTKTGLQYYLLMRQADPPFGEGILPDPGDLLHADWISREE